MPLAEKALIARLRRVAAAKSPNLIAGIGDDCAVLRVPAGHELLVTTDFTLEGIHFRREWHSPEIVGHRCLTRGLSDIAAMGGEPVAAFLSLALPRSLPQSWVDRFMKGFLKLAKRHGVPFAGGDIAESPNGILADIVVLGSVFKGKAILRSGARPGDRIYVTGELGGSTATLLELRKHPGRKLNPKNYAPHFFPQPRLKLGAALRATASAMIDLSDGLSTDLMHICEESGVGAELQMEAIPLASIGKPSRLVSLETALHGGEDYELLFTAPARKRVPARIGGVQVTEIGRIIRGEEMRLLLPQGAGQKLTAKGWEHFKR